MKWPVYGIHPHNPGEPCSSRCILTDQIRLDIATSVLDGVLYMTPLEAQCRWSRSRCETLSALCLVDCALPSVARQMSVTYETTEINRPAVELLFDLCTICKERRRNCVCHERGYN